MDFLQWWQAADYAAKATFIGTIIATLALIWSVFVYLVSRRSNGESDKVAAKKQSVAAGRDIKGSITIGAPSDKA
ncbi:MAG: hypothetical protein ACR2RF_06275 [Geminicoccaceae bacterium]